MMNSSLDGRLSSAAKFVRQGARFADIGTDHAYLPIFLLLNKIIDSAVCSDINEGPLNTAREHARAAGVFDRIEFILADGADALCGKGITDFAICGMGGELISEIIERAKFLRCGGVRLILQPMSRPAFVRRTLARLGFSTVGESYSEVQGKLYVTICADYAGKARSISESEAEFGEEKFILPLREEKLLYFKRKREALKKAAAGKAAGGEENSREAELFSYINDIINENGENV